MIAAIVTVLAFLAALYLALRARRLAADLRRVSAELDQAHLAGAALMMDDRVAWARRARVMRAALQTTADEADALKEELAEIEKGQASIILAMVEDAEQTEAERDQLRDRVSGLEAAIEAMTSRIAELRAPRETSASIASWQTATFGEATTVRPRVDYTTRKLVTAQYRAATCDLTIPRPNLSRAIRAAEELAELIMLLVANDADPKAPEEVADIDIVLRGIDAAHGVERAAVVDAKMSRNRARTWSLTGDGHGQHVEEPAS